MANITNFSGVAKFSGNGNAIARDLMLLLAAKASMDAAYHAAYGRMIQAIANDLLHSRSSATAEAVAQACDAAGKPQLARKILRQASVKAGYYASINAAGEIIEHDMPLLEIKRHKIRLTTRRNGGVVKQNSGQSVLIVRIAPLAAQSYKDERNTFWQGLAEKSAMLAEVDVASLQFARKEDDDACLLALRQQAKLAIRQAKLALASPDSEYACQLYTVARQSYSLLCTQGVQFTDEEHAIFQQAMPTGDRIAL